MLKKEGLEWKLELYFLTTANTASDGYNKCLFEIQLLYIA